jgi:hypothetical protein
MRYLSKLIFILAMTTQISWATLLQQYYLDKRLSNDKETPCCLDQNNDALIMIEYLEDLKSEPKSKQNTQLVHQIINRTKGLLFNQSQMVIYAMCIALPCTAQPDVEAIIQEAMLSDYEQDKAEIYLQYLKYPHAKAEIIKQLIKDVGKFSDSE